MIITSGAYYLWSLSYLKVITGTSRPYHIWRLLYLELISSEAYHIKAYCIRNVSYQEQIVSVLSISEAYCLRDKLCFVKISIKSFHHKVVTSVTNNVSENVELAVHEFSLVNDVVIS